MQCQHPSGSQDFALVISTEAGAAGLGVSDQPQGFDGTPLVSIVTNGVPLLNQRVGANSPLILSTNGASNQWHFFIVTNQLPSTDTSGGSPTHIAFTTFLTANSIDPAHPDEADIDSARFNGLQPHQLNTTTINNAFQSRRRGGTESIVIDDATPGALLRGRKIRGPTGATFGIFAVSSSVPFSGLNQDGNLTATGYLLQSDIPDAAGPPTGGIGFAYHTGCAD
jgi:hypothetical protein